MGVSSSDGSIERQGRMPMTGFAKDFDHRLGR